MMNGRILAYLVLLICGGCVSGYSPAYSDVCTRETAIQAEATIDSMNSWNTLYSAYKKFSQCDDGAIAEGFSDVIVRLLIEHPISFKPLDNDKGFRVFVLNHIGELMTESEFTSLRAKVSQCGPGSTGEFCKKLKAKLEVM